ISRLNEEMLRPTSSLIAGAEQEAITTPAAPAAPAASASAPEGPSPHTGEQWIYGNARARFTLLELTDTECPYCREHSPVRRAHIDASGGNIKGALLHVHGKGEVSRRQEVVIECAREQGGSDAAWAMMDTILNTTPGNGQGMEKP